MKAAISLRTATLVAGVATFGSLSCGRPEPTLERSRERTSRVVVDDVSRGERRRPADRELVAASSKRNGNVYAGTLTGELDPSARGVPERIYVPNSLADTVDVIDPRRGKVIAHYGVGSVPHHVAPSWDMSRLYVDNTSSNSLTELDPVTGKPKRTISVEDPYNLYFTPDGSKAVVVAERFRRLDFRDPHSWRLLKSVSIPSPGANHLDFSADGSFLVVSTEWGGHLYKVDTRRMKVTDVLRVGGLPVDVRLDPDGSVFYVANQGRHGVSVVDATRLRQTAFIPTRAGAHGLCVSRDTKRLYVSNRVDGSISVIDFNKRKVVDTWDVGGSPDMMQVSRDGRELWFSNRLHSSVSAVDTRTGEVLKTIQVGAGAHGLALFPQPGSFSIGHNGVYR